MSAQSNRVGAVALLVCWTLTLVAFVTRTVLTADFTPLILDTDDAMRLVTVRDLLAGQGWFDPIQHRLNTPYGGEMHWSRLVDLPEAALLFLLRPLFGAAADVALAYAWPLLLLLPLLWLSGKLALRLGGPRARLPGLLLPAFSLSVMNEFAPGRLDHHSLQIVLTLAMLYAAIAALERPRFALLAGVAAALSLAIGIEGLPIVLAALLAFGLAWVTDIRHAAALRDFGLSFALGTSLALAQGVPPDRWLVPATDAISIVYAGAALCCGMAFLVLSLTRFVSWRSRLLAGIAAGIIVLALVIGLFPAILRGPYGMLDPWLLANWIDRISEAEPWLVSVVGEPSYPVAVLVPCLAALAVAGWHIRRRPAQRDAWFVYALLLVIATLVMLLQIRGARIALPLAIPACAVLIGAAWQRMVTSRGFGPIFAWLGSWLVAASVAVAIATAAIVLAVPNYAATTVDAFRGSRQACLRPEAFSDLASLPPQRLMTPIDLGSHMLLFTPHSVVAAPYHRNQQGVLDTFRFFNGPIEAGRDILAARGISLVVICPAMREIRGLVDYTPDSFVSLFAADRLPDWLVEESRPGSPLRIYAVRPR